VDTFFKEKESFRFFILIIRINSLPIRVYIFIIVHHNIGFLTVHIYTSLIDPCSFSFAIQHSRHEVHTQAIRSHKREGNTSPTLCLFHTFSLLSLSLSLFLAVTVLQSIDFSGTIYSSLPTYTVSIFMNLQAHLTPSNGIVLYSILISYPIALC
jgi:hypothetical protein